MNTFVGRNSGQCISTGANNTGFGYRALAAGRGPIGLSGLIENHYPVTTSHMTAFGASCLELSRGNANTGLGRNAGKNPQQGSLNVKFGFGADRKGVGAGKNGYVRVDLGGRRV